MAKEPQVREKPNISDPDAAEDREMEGGPSAAARLKGVKPGVPEGRGREGTKAGKMDSKIANITLQGDHTGITPVEGGVKGDGEARGGRGAKPEDVSLV